MKNEIDGIDEIDEIDGIKVFNPEISNEHEDYNSKILDELYNAENKLFWSIYRKEFILDIFLSYVSKESNIIEIGAGTGNVSRYLMDHNYQNISVGEMHLNGLRYAKSYGIKNCYQFDLYQTPFENMFDVVAMFDVLEHLSDDELALNQCFKMLRNNGLIIITVPAHMWLWSRNDRVAGHKRRYTKNEIKEKMVKVGFEIIEIKYFFILITPLLYLRSLIDQDDGSPISNKENFKYFNLPSYVNLALMLICNFEKFIQKLLPDKFGGSLILIGKKGSVINSVSFL